MIEFLLRYKRITFFLLLILLVSFFHYSEILSFPSFPVRIAGVTGSLSEWLFSLPSAILNRESADMERDLLRQEVSRLKIAESSCRTANDENKRLREILDIPIEEELKPLGAKVIMGGITSFSRSLFINRGASDGVIEGAPVLFEDKIAGKVKKVSANISLVYLVNHPDICVDVISPRTGARGVFEGGTNCSVKYVDSEQEIIPGDELYSSGRGGVFPPRYRVGIVKTVNPKKTGVFQSVTAETVIDPRKIDFVFIVKFPSPESVKELYEEE